MVMMIGEIIMRVCDDDGGDDDDLVRVCEMKREEGRKKG